MAATRPFWETTALADMTPEQWEALCDGCARCCLQLVQTAAGAAVTEGLPLLGGHIRKGGRFPERALSGHHRLRG